MFCFRGGRGAKLIILAIGTVQEDCGPSERVVFDLQFSGQVERDGCCYFSTAWRCGGCEDEV